jgi:glyoxylase-like metal-dependent hydrolase (beta-lactamase superfamily II)
MMDRRQFLIGSTSAIAASSVAAQSGIDIMTLSDGSFIVPSTFLARESDQPKALEALKTSGVYTPEHRNPLNVTLLRRANEVILFDCGAGPNFMSGAGKLQEALSAAGVEPEKVTHVLFTHAHPDHLWGALDDFGTPAFPNAKYHISGIERDFWLSPQAFTVLPESLHTVSAGAQRHLKEISSVLSTFKGGEEVLPGIAAIATPGHTPGHMSFEIRSGSDSMMVLGDTLTHALLAFAHPQIATGADQDGDLAVATRKSLLDRLASEKISFIGYHLPNGGRGRAERAGSAYRLVQA